MGAGAGAAGRRAGGLALVLAGVALGLLGRAAPSLPLVSLALPVRVAVGLVLVLAGVGAAAGLFAAAWREALAP